MKDKARTRWMKMVYGNQIKEYFYEEYVSFDNLRRIRTYCVLEDMYSRLIKLDEYGSFIFLQIDGKKTVEEIGENLESEYGDATHPLYERLTMYLNHIYVNCNYIERIN